MDSCIFNSETVTKKVNSGLGKPLFLSEFTDKVDIEVACTIIAWLTNGWDGEREKSNEFISEVMLPTPKQFILNYPTCEIVDCYSSFFRLLTHGNLANLIARLKHIIEEYGSMEACFLLTASKQKKRTYNHTIFIEMFGGNTGFQSSPTLKCTFFRYNLLYYFLVQKYKVWCDKHKDNTLLPCNDLIFAKAHEKGITKTCLKTTLRNSETLTSIAKDMYGNNDFYKLYESLNSNADI